MADKVRAPPCPVCPQQFCLASRGQRVWPWAADGGRSPQMASAPLGLPRSDSLAHAVLLWLSKELWVVDLSCLLAPPPRLPSAPWGRVGGGGSEGVPAAKPASLPPPLPGHCHPHRSSRCSLLAVGLVQAVPSHVPRPCRSPSIASLVNEACDACTTVDGHQADTAVDGLRAACLDSGGYACREQTVLHSKLKQI